MVLCPVSENQYLINCQIQDYLVMLCFSYYSDFFSSFSFSVFIIAICETDNNTREKAHFRNLPQTKVYWSGFINVPYCWCSLFRFNLGSAWEVRLLTGAKNLWLKNTRSVTYDYSSIFALGSPKASEIGKHPPHQTQTETSSLMCSSSPRWRKTVTNTFWVCERLSANFNLSAQTTTTTTTKCITLETYKEWTISALHSHWRTLGHIIPWEAGIDKPKPCWYNTAKKQQS